MKLTRDAYLQLFDRYVNGRATPDEIELLMAHKDEFELSEVDNYVLTDDDIEAAKRIKSRIDKSIAQAPVRTLRSYTRWYAAAMVLIMITAGLLVWNSSNYQAPANTQVVKNLANDAKPGGEKAILILANGKQIILNDSESDTLIDQGHITIKKPKKGMIQYVVAAGSPSGTNALEYNTIATPRGGEYQIILPDGTKVWLNAASSLRFPTAFIGKERLVELTGEGYFEVEKDKRKPFKVKFNDQLVEVLGTHFNIMAYDDEAEAKTTLLEGSVKISRNNIKQLLLPGQQAIAGARQDGFKVQQANVQQVMAWKNGYFMFRNVSIDKIMRQAARWYDVDIVYEGDWVEKAYGGRISKYKNISELLHNLELTGTIHFKVEGRRVTVMH